MIAIIDYGMGNLRSVQKAFEFVGCEAFLTDKADDLENSKGIVLPGVGAFLDARNAIEEKGLTDVIIRQVQKGKPFFGICLGMQLLFDSSEEGGANEGFGLLQGQVARLPESVKIPHMGWNTLKLRQNNNAIYENIDADASFYFVHSFYVRSDDDSIKATTTDYGVEFVSSVSRDNVFACQYHPEKSGDEGLKILKNFARLCL